MIFQYNKFLEAYGATGFSLRSVRLFTEFVFSDACFLMLVSKSSGFGSLYTKPFLNFFSEKFV